MEFGGNTSCYEVRCGDALVILDGGTGLRLLGQDLLKEMPIEAWMFFSHVHWDHIQGFPFFAPAFMPDFRLNIHCTKDAKSILERQMQTPFFPVGLDVMAATPRIAHRRELRMDELQAGIETPNRQARLNHLLHQLLDEGRR